MYGAGPSIRLGFRGTKQLVKNARKFSLDRALNVSQKQVMSSLVLDHEDLSTHIPRVEVAQSGRPREETRRLWRGSRLGDQKPEGRLPFLPSSHLIG